MRAVAIAILWCGAASGAIRVEQILHAPSVPGQTINSLTADRQGNLIVTGTNGSITRLDAQGNVVFTFANFGTYPAGAVADANGDVYWIGSAGFDFPFTKKVLPAEHPNLASGFVVRFRADGSIVWAAEIEALQPQAIALDAAGGIVLAGRANTGDVRPIAIARLTSAGDAVSITTFGGHSLNDPRPCQSGRFFLCPADLAIGAAAVLLDPQGHIWVAGPTLETDLPVTSNALQKTGGGFLAEFSPDGAAVLYATYLGSGPNDAIDAAALDPSGRIWLAGTNGLVLAYDPAANRISYSTRVGTEGVNTVTRVAVDPDGNPVFSGHLNSNEQNPYTAGTDFVAVLKPAGIEITSFLHNAADAGLAFSPSGALIAAGSRGAISMLRDSAAASPSIFAVANAASLQASGQIAPGEIVAITGAHLGANGTVLFDGVPATVLSAADDRIDAVAPFELAGRKETTLVVEPGGFRSNEARLGVVDAVPAVFLSEDASGGYMPVAAAVNQDGTINSESNPAPAGSIVSIYGTGFGVDQHVGMFGPGFVDVLYAGAAPGQIAGVTQINFRVETESGAPPTIVLFAGGWPADYFTVWVR